MKLDDLKTAWREEMEVTQPLFSFRLQRLAKEVNKIERDNLLGSIVMSIMAVFFAVFFVAISRIIDLGWFQLLNCAVIVTWLGYGAFRFLRVNKSNADDNWTLAARLSRGRELLEKQKNFTKNLFLKWCAPMLVWGVLMIYVSFIVKTGDYIPPLKYLAIASLILALTITGGWLAALQTKEKYEPLIRQLDELKKQIAEE